MCCIKGYNAGNGQSGCECCDGMHIFVLVGSKVETQLESPSTIQAPTATGSVTRSSTGENRETLINGIIGYYEVDRTTCLKGKQGCNSIDILNLGQKPLDQVLGQLQHWITTSLTPNMTWAMLKELY